MGPEAPVHDWTRTRAALAEYDRGQAGRDAQLEAVATEDDEQSWQDAVEAARDLVRLAFWEDTKDLNSQENCLITGIDFIRRCAR